MPEPDDFVFSLPGLARRLRARFYMIALRRRLTLIKVWVIETLVYEVDGEVVNASLAWPARVCRTYPGGLMEKLFSRVTVYFNQEKYLNAEYIDNEITDC